MQLVVLLALALGACAVPNPTPTPTSRPVGSSEVAVGETATPRPQAPAPAARPALTPAGTPEPTPMRVSLQVVDTPNPAPSRTAAQPTPAQGIGQPPVATSRQQGPERWTGNPSCPQEVPPGPTVMGPVELSGAVCGLVLGEKATIILRRATEIGSVIVTLVVGNGDWGRPSIELTPGVYVLEATAGSAGHNGFPAAYGFTVSSGATAWKLGGLAFDFSTRGGTPGTAGVPNPSIGGAVSGLKSGDAATITVYGVPRVEGRCYTNYNPPAGCSPSPGPQPIAQVPDLSHAWLLAGFESAGPEWRLVSTDLQPGRYLVIALVSGGAATPMAYGVDLPMEHLVSGSVSGVDFAFAYTLND